MTKNKISGYLMVLSIMTFLAIFFYIVQTSYNKLIKPSVELSKSGLLRPIESDLDIGIIDQIEKRSYIETNNLIFDSQPIVTVVPTPTL